MVEEALYKSLDKVYNRTWLNRLDEPVVTGAEVELTLDRLLTACTFRTRVSAVTGETEMMTRIQTPRVFAVNLSKFEI